MVLGQAEDDNDGDRTSRRRGEVVEGSDRLVHVAASLGGGGGGGSTGASRIKAEPVLATRGVRRDSSIIAHATTTDDLDATAAAAAASSSMELGHDHGPGSSHRPPPPAYADGSWMDLAPFEPSPHLSPAHEYTGFDDVPTSPNQSMNVSTETNLTQIHPPSRPMQALRPLVVPPWPSTLTGLSSFATPILPTPPSSTVTTVSSSAASLSAPISAVSNRSIRSNSTPRRTLTDTDRRRMCRYHEEHPTVKQTEIGGEYGLVPPTID